MEELVQYIRDYISDIQYEMDMCDQHDIEQWMKLYGKYLAANDILEKIHEIQLRQ